MILQNNIGAYLTVCKYNPYAAFIQGNRSSPGSPWPQPVTMETASTALTLNPLTFKFTSRMTDCDIISNAISRYQDIIKLDKHVNMDEGLSEMKRLQINVEDTKCPGYPQLQMKESCTYITY